MAVRSDIFIRPRKMGGVARRARVMNYRPPLARAQLAGFIRRGQQLVNDLKQRRHVNRLLHQGNDPSGFGHLDLIRLSADNEEGQRWIDFDQPVQRGSPVSQRHVQVHQQQVNVVEFTAEGFHRLRALEPSVVLRNEDDRDETTRTLH